MAKRYKKKKRSRKVLAVCVFVELAALLVLLTVIFWNRGLMAWIQSFSVPVVKELDVSGINSPNAVLMQVCGGKTGYTDDAGLCLASYAEIGGMEYILVTAGAPSGTGTPLHVEDAQTIYNRLGEACIKLSMRS